MVTPQPRGCTNFKLRQLLRRVSLVYDHAMAECGLKITQYSLLSHWIASADPQADLARAMAMDTSRLSRNLRPAPGGRLDRRRCWRRCARVTRWCSPSPGVTKRNEAQALWKKAQLQLNGRSAWMM